MGIPKPKLTICPASPVFEENTTIHLKSDRTCYLAELMTRLPARFLEISSDIGALPHERGHEKLHSGTRRPRSKNTQ